MRAALLAAVFLLLGGCLDGFAGEDLAGEAPPGPPVDWPVEDPPRFAWSNASAELWAVRSVGCGLCPGDPDWPSRHAVALYRDGGVLVVDYSTSYGLGMESDHSRVGLGPLEPILQGLLGRAQVSGDWNTTPGADEALRVLGAATGQLPPEEFASLEAELQGALSDPGEPGPAFPPTDCSPTVLQAFGEPLEARVEDGCEATQGPGWQAFGAALARLDGWVRTAGDTAVEGSPGSAVPALAFAYDGREPSTAIRAAVHVQACGGQDAGCSGVSGAILFGDGRVSGFWGMPLAGGSQGRTYCPAGFHDGELLVDLLGEAWAIPCLEGAQDGAWLAQVRVLPPGAWDVIRGRLADMGPLHVPPGLGDAPCCDRVHTLVRLYDGSSEGLLVLEGTDVQGAREPLAGSVPLAVQLLDLMDWMRPSIGGVWTTWPPE